MRLHKNDITDKQSAFSISKVIKDDSVALSFINSPKLTSKYVSISNTMYRDIIENSYISYIDQNIDQNIYALNGKHNKDILITNKYATSGEPLYYYSKISYSGQSIISSEIVDEYDTKIKMIYSIETFSNYIVVYHSCDRDKEYSISLSFKDGTHKIERLSLNKIYVNGDLNYQDDGIAKRYLRDDNGKISLIAESLSIINHNDRKPISFSYNSIANISPIRNIYKPINFKIGVLSKEVDKSFLSIVETFFINRKDILPQYLNISVEKVNFNLIKDYSLIITDNGFISVQYTNDEISLIESYLINGGKLFVDYTTHSAVSGEAILFNDITLFIGEDDAENIDISYNSEYHEIDPLTRILNPFNLDRYTIDQPIGIGLEMWAEYINPIILCNENSNSFLCKTNYAKIGEDISLIKGEIFISGASMFYQMANNIDEALSRFIINIISSMSSNLYITLPKNNQILYHVNQLFDEEYKILPYEKDEGLDGERIAKLVLFKDIKEYISDFVDYDIFKCNLYVYSDSLEIKAYGAEEIQEGEFYIKDTHELSFYTNSKPYITPNTNRFGPNSIVKNISKTHLQINIESYAIHLDLDVLDLGITNYSLYDILKEHISKMNFSVNDKSIIEIICNDSSVDLKFSKEDSILYDIRGNTFITFKDVIDNLIILSIKSSNYSILKGEEFLYTIANMISSSNLISIEPNLTDNLCWNVKIKNFDFYLSNENLYNYKSIATRALKQNDTDFDSFLIWVNKNKISNSEFHYKCNEYFNQYFDNDDKEIYIKNEIAQYKNSNSITLINKNIKEATVRRLIDIKDLSNEKMIKSGNYYIINNSSEYIISKIIKIKNRYGSLVPPALYNLSSDKKSISFDSSISLLSSPFYIDAILYKWENLIIANAGIYDNIIKLSDKIKFQDIISVDYTYRVEDLEYRGYIDDNGAFVSLDLNPSDGHTYTKLTTNDKGFITYNHAAPSKELIDTPIYFYILPINEKANIRHTDDPEELSQILQRNPGSLYIGNASVSIDFSPLDIDVLDLRQYGGGLNEKGLKNFKTSAGLFWDTKLSNSVIYPNGIGIIKLPKDLLIENCGLFTADSIKEIVKNHLGLGIYPIIKFEE